MAAGARVVSFPLSLILWFCSLVTLLHCYKPVVLMHGLLNGPEELNNLTAFIQKVHPGTNTTIINGYDGIFSLRPMWDQVGTVRENVEATLKEHPEGIHLLCYSQGGLACRAAIETLPNHNIHNLISLSSPQGGQFGDTEYLKYLFPEFMRHNIYRLFYTKYGQSISIANYWNDPHHQDLYKNISAFLTFINNEVLSNNSKEYKTAFTQLENLVLIGGPDDGVIAPWQSSHFAAYNASDVVLDMYQQEWYTKDLFGLRTLDERKAVHTYTVPGVGHHQWHSNFTVFQKCIEPWLT